MLLTTWLQDDVDGHITGQKNCVALIEVVSTSSSDKAPGKCILTATQITLALELAREGWSRFRK